MKTRTGLVVGTVLSLGLVTGCGGDGGTESGTKATGSPKASASAAAAGQPVYKGEPIPGLAAKPAWSLAQKDGEDYSCAGDAAFDRGDQLYGTDTERVCQVGDAYLLVEDLTPSVDDSDSETQTAHFVAHLYDAATGKERKAFTVKCDYDPAESGDGPSFSTHVQVGEWKDGSPAVLIRTCENTEASGLKAATVKTVYTMYDTSGAELGSSALTGEENIDLPVIRGHVKMPDDEVTFAPIGGGKDFVVDEYLADEDVVGTGQGYVVAYEGAYSPLRLIDRTTGKTVWNTEDDLTPPDELLEMDGGDENQWDLFPLQGDQATLVWSPLGIGDTVITTVDLPTGRTVAVGPTVTVSLATTDLTKMTVSPDGKTAVADFGEGAVAWNTRTGAELWRQEADDKDIEPLVITPGGVLYATLDGGEVAALAVATKELLGTFPSGTEAPTEFTSNGYTLIDTADGLFAFEAEKA